MVDDAPPPSTEIELACWDNAPAPLTVSEAARQALAAFPNKAAEGDLATHRAMCAGVQRDLGGAQLRRYGVEMRESEIAGVPVRIFTPPQASERVLLNLHGGGFIVDAGSVTENAPIAALTGLTVVAARYRLAPEHSFPAAVDDAEAVYDVLLEKVGAQSIGLYGTSAGALLCAQLLARLRRDKRPLPKAFGFFSGTADLTRSGDSEHFFRPFNEVRAGKRLFEDYVRGHERTDPALSPIFSDLGAFPPTLCIAGTRDFMLSQTSLFHQALLRAGVDARLAIFEAMPHAHWIFLDLPESDAAFSLMAAFFREQLGTEAVSPQPGARGSVQL